MDLIVQCHFCKRLMPLNKITEDCKANLRDADGGRLSIYGNNLDEKNYYGSHFHNIRSVKKTSKVVYYIRLAVWLGLLACLFKDGVPTTEQVCKQWWLLVILSLTGFA